MVSFTDLLNQFTGLVPILRTLLVIIIFFTLFNLILTFIKKHLLKRLKSKRHISNVEIFSRIAQYVTFILLLIFGFFSYAGSWTGFGITVGLMSAALGWALQKPITGVAAWIMIVFKRPFDIGDRIIVGNVRGDVADISLTHIYLREIGGTISSEENSGRLIMVPNSIMFEQNIINYTARDEYVLDEVVTAITYESDLKKAIEIILDKAKLNTEKFDVKDPYIRSWFQASGVNVHVRYMVPAKKRQEVSSLITQDIHSEIMKTKGVQIAYPHTEVLLNKN